MLNLEEMEQDISKGGLCTLYYPEATVLETQPQPTIRCGTCGIPFKKTAYLKRHNCKIVNHKIYQCICKKTLSTQWNLKVHRKYAASISKLHTYNFIKYFSKGLN